MSFIRKIKSKGGITPCIKLAIKHYKNGGSGHLILKLNSFLAANSVKFEPTHIRISDLKYLFIKDGAAVKSILPCTVDIIVPVHNGFEYLEGLFNTIFNNTSTKFRLIIFDDASTDNRVSILLSNLTPTKLCDELIIISNDKNIGFVKTVNNAMNYVKSPYVAILNTDVQVPPYWLQRLIQPMTINNKVASTTPFTNSGTICSFPNYLQDNKLFANLPFEDIDFEFSKVNIDNTCIEIPTGVGFCMGINSKVLNEIGKFDEAFNMGYGEENDWCMRAQAAGYKNIHVTNLFVYHKHGGSFTKDNKESYLSDNTKILIKKHPQYFNLIEKTTRENSLDNLRRLIACKLLALAGSTTLYINHNLGGGANEYLKDKIKANENHINIILTYCNIKGLYLDLKTGGANDLTISLDSYDEIEEVVKFFNIKEIFINSIVSFNDPLNILTAITKLKKQGAHIIYPLHDYYPICPSYNLLNNHIEYCNIPTDLSVCHYCICNSRYLQSIQPFEKANKVNIDSWRSKWRLLLSQCDKIIAFSQSSLGILLKVYPELACKTSLEPHSVSWSRTAHKLSYANSINIAVIGTLTISKGANIISCLANFCKNNNLEITIHIFGKNIDVIRPPQNVTLHGAYDKNKLSNLIEDNNIDIIIIPSIWPETFSYTTEEVIKMDIPLITLNLGAQGDKCNSYYKGLSLDKATPHEILYAVSKLVAHKASLLRSIDHAYDNNIKLHQIYYNKSQLHSISKYATPYFNSEDNDSKIWHEFGVFVREYVKMSYKHYKYSGYVSWRFEEKTTIKLHKFLNFILENPGYDVYFINPFPELELLYKNVWDQGEEHHPGITQLAQELLNIANLNVKISEIQFNSNTMGFCNYWVGNNKFWEEFLNFTLPIYKYLSNITEKERLKYLKDSGYHTGVGYIPFIMERMFSTFLETSCDKISYKKYNYTDTDIAKMTKLLRIKAQM